MNVWPHQSNELLEVWSCNGVLLAEVIEDVAPIVKVYEFSIIILEDAIKVAGQCELAVLYVPTPHPSPGYQPTHSNPNEHERK